MHKTMMINHNHHGQSLGFLEILMVMFSSSFSLACNHRFETNGPPLLLAVLCEADRRCDANDECAGTADPRIAATTNTASMVILVVLLLILMVGYFKLLSFRVSCSASYFVRHKDRFGC